MKKVLMSAAFLCFLCGKLFSQVSSTGPSASFQGGKFSVGLDVGVPVGDAHNFYSFAVGGDLKYLFPMTKNVSISLSAGYTSLTAKTLTESVDDGSGNITTVSVKQSAEGVIPVKAGLRFAAGTVGFFGEAQIGAAFLNHGGGTAFLYAPAVGYAFTGGFEAGIRYEGWSENTTIAQVALHIAYSF